MAGQDDSGEWVSLCCRYTGHCPLLRFSMGQTYGQVTAQLLRDPPGLAWPPVHRTLLPPIRPPKSPEVPRESLPLRHGHERLSSSMIPGYTGFVPRAQFIFAKNCSQVWAEALSDFTHLHGKQGSEELPKEAKGRKDTEKDQASPYSMDDRDPRKFFMSGFTDYVPRARFFFGSSFPVLSNQALQEFGQKHSPGSAQKDPKYLPPLPRTYPQNLGLLPTYGGYVPGEKSPQGGFGDWNVCVGMGVGWGGLWGLELIDMGGLRSCGSALSLGRKGN
ncbi:protein FAM166B isoform X2 [Trachypithecus francoisi]|uniref:protein FAM166B isoform X2 n=1 Tax=Trachypithecus francoisi TaxID=54180 RepID=UPI00141BAD95|nr:protein FAM166B isoform X2 [Trachypithecus francoisi]